VNKVLTYIFLSKEQSGIHLVQERERAERRLHNLGTWVPIYQPPSFLLSLDKHH
jgi:hypothetical protein